MACVAADGTVTACSSSLRCSAPISKGALHKGEIGVVRHHRLREGGELHALAAKLEDFCDDLVHGAFAAVEHRADLYGGGFDDGHGGILFCSSGTSTPGTGNRNVLEYL